MATELDLQEVGLTAYEARIVYDLCVRSARITNVPASDLVWVVCKSIINVPTYKEKLRSIIMNPGLVITERQLQDIDWCMKYSESYNHGADGHNRMNTVALMAKALGFTRDSNGEIMIPIGATVDRGGPTTGHGTTR